MRCLEMTSNHSLREQVLKTGKSFMMVISTRTDKSWRRRIYQKCQKSIQSQVKNSKRLFHQLLSSTICHSSQVVANLAIWLSCKISFQDSQSINVLLQRRRRKEFGATTIQKDGEQVTRDFLDHAHQLL